MAKELGKVAQDDLLLKNYAQEISSQAVLLVYTVRGKIYRSVEVKEAAKETGLKEEEVRTRVEEVLKKEGYHVESTDGRLNVMGQIKEGRNKIQNKAVELVKRTKVLHEHFKQL